LLLGKEVIGGSEWYFVRCNICYLPIEERTVKENCPRCFNNFHKDHFAAWLLDHDYCPMCREQLSASFREELRPKTEKERERLEEIMNRLDGIGDMLKQLETKERRRIMASRSKEFGLEDTSFIDYLKISVPFILLGLFLILVILGVLGNL